MINSIKLFLKSLSKAEIIICLTNIVVSIIFFIVSCNIQTKNVYGYSRWQTYVSLFANLLNTWSCILLVKKKWLTYVVGLAACILLGAINYDAKIFGLMMAYWAIYIPSEIWAVIVWYRNRNKEENIVETRKMKWPNFALYLLILLACAVGFSFLEGIDAFSRWWLNGEVQSYPLRLFDSITVVSMISVSYLLIKRYSQTWIVYIMCDFCLISIAIIKLCGNVTDFAFWNIILIAITMLSFNACGIINWRNSK